MDQEDDVHQPTGQEKIEKYIARQKQLLHLERDTFLESKARELKELGNRLKVKIASTRVPKYGGTLVTFKAVMSKTEAKFPPFKKGNLVGVDLGYESDVLNGILVNIKATAFEVHLKESKDVFKENKFYDLLNADDEGFFEQCELALDFINENKTPLKDIIFGLSQPSGQKLHNMNFINKDLDNSQKAAVEFSSGHNELAVIHGPPGTGKTTTLVEIIFQAVVRGEKVLFSAPSNTAVDNIAERLDKQGVKILRIGHPARVADSVLEHTLDVMLVKQIERVKDIEAQIRDVRITLEKKWVLEFEKDISALEKEIKRLFIQLKKQKQILTEQMKLELMKTQVVLGTLAGCGTRGPLGFLPEDHFQLTVIDECSQALEVACWIAIHKSPKLILAGDHHQLPPTIFNKKIEKELSQTLMKRIQKNKTCKSVVKMLTVQYRMNFLIMRWSSTTFYSSKLLAAPKVADHKLSDLNHVTECTLTNTVLMLIDTKEKQMRETKSSSKSAPSYANLGEAGIVINHVRSLVKSGVKASEIAIVTPYSLQVDLLSVNLVEEFPELEIKSVDGFQGREKEAVILSMVRSNNSQVLGFLVDQRRLNVGVTRARRQLVIVCDSQTVGKDQFIGNFVNYVRKRGVVQSPSKGVDVSKLDAPRDLSVMRGKTERLVLLREPVKQANPKNNIKLKLGLADNLVGLDCEMVGVGDDREDILARVSVVNHSGDVLIDTFVLNSLPVTEFRTDKSGVRPENLIGAPDFDTVRNQVKELLDGKIIVGHGLYHDMDVLHLHYPINRMRDTSKYRPFLRRRGVRTPSLKSLAQKYLGMDIQGDEHDSVEDARAAMNLYMMFRKDWEREVASLEEKGKFSETWSNSKKPRKVPKREFQLIIRNRFAELDNIEESDSDFYMKQEDKSRS